MTNETSNVNVPVEEAALAKPPSADDSAGQFVHLSESLKSNCPKDKLVEARRLLASASITLANAADICRSLGQFQVPESGEMLAQKWAEIPVEVRHIFLRWKWDGKKTKQIVTNCLIASAGILHVDRASALDLLGHAVQRAKGVEAEEAAITWFRLTWMSPKRRSASLPPPLEQLAWPDLDRRWREQFFRLATDSATGKYPPRTEALPSQIRPNTAKWMRELGAQAGADGVAFIHPYLVRLDPSPTAVASVPPPTVVPAVEPVAARQASEVQPLSAPTSTTPTDPIHAGVQQSEVPRPTSPTAQPITQAVLQTTSGRALSEPPPGAPEHPQGTRESTVVELGPVLPRADLGRGQPVRNRARFEQLLVAIQQVHTAVAALAEDTERGTARRSSEDEGARKQLEHLFRERQRADAAESAVDSLRAEVRRIEAMRDEVRGQLARTADALGQARGEIARLTQELDATRQQAGREREDNRRHTDTERQEAVRSFAQQLGEGLHHYMLNLKESELQPPSEKQAKFLRVVVNSIVKRLRTAGVPIDGADVPGQEGTPQES